MKRLPIALPLLLIATARAADPPAAASQPATHYTYPISKIIPAYYRDDKDNPPIADLLKATVTLAIVDGIYTAPTADHKGQPIPLEKIGSDTPGGASYLDASAVKNIYQAITDFYNNDRHLVGIFTVVDSKEIDQDDQDRRTDHTSLTFIVILSRVAELHTHHYRPETNRYDTDDPADADILKNCPVQPDGKNATDLLNKALLDDYTAALKKKSHIDAETTLKSSDSGKLGEVVVEFLIDSPLPPTSAPKSP